MNSCGGKASQVFSKTQKLQSLVQLLKLEYMSSIIDDLIFYRQKTSIAQSDQEEKTGKELEQLSKNFLISQGAILLNFNLTSHEILNKLSLKNHDYSVRLKIDDYLKSVRLEARLLQASQFKRISSKHNQIALLKEVAKHQYQVNSQYPFCIVKGCIIMLQKIYFFLFDPRHTKKAIEFYNSTFTKNFKQFQQFVCQQVSSTYKNSYNHSASKNYQNDDLLLTQNLCTSKIDFGIHQDQTNFDQIEEALRKRRNQINKVITNITQHTIDQQASNSLFLVVHQKLKSKWLKEHLKERFQLNFKLFSKFLGVSKFLGDKKIEDFIFNMVKVNLKEIYSKPFAQGGSCHLFLVKAEMTFINSVDNTSYFKNDEKKEKVIAMKKLKPQLYKMMKNKFDHEKQIVSKLKGGVSYFIPKYYKVEQALDREDTLLMEFVQGEQLDKFLSYRQQTLSLQTKVCILLNVVHGMLHLSSYRITHLDLKPINILVCRNNYLITKIIDFGQAHHPEVCDQNYSPGFTFPYVAPQVLDPQSDFKFSEKQDVFAFGFIMFQVIFSQKIFECRADKLKEMYKKKEILERLLLTYQKVEDYGNYLAVSSIIHLILRCLDNNPQKRPCFDWIGIQLRLILNLGSGNT